VVQRETPPTMQDRSAAVWMARYLSSHRPGRLLGYL